MLRICLVFVLLLPTLTHAAERLAGRVDVIDADTWDVGGVRVRLHGIDAPELDQTCQDSDGSSWPCGAWATHRVRQKYQGQTASCVPLDRDRYGRIIAQCKVERVDVAAQIVGQGLAFAYRKYSDVYVRAEKGAKVRNRGLHQTQVQVPWVHRAEGKTKSSEGCRIKGNVSSKGEKAFHVPGQTYYAKTRISAAKGERWFCSTAEARAAGWRAARR
ncbi:thermonuclease family protein [uncultured Ruegeria sp.]|uniref:thermonuclease family protein n=1 Tax=uncultured Ruegeria sp. TaxID=259304 RepID=UPI0026035795|nr:thermonuclease family protein [uncultured Ruegeria sp.]